MADTVMFTAFQLFLLLLILVHHTTVANQDAPAINNMSPRSGSRAGGTRVTLFGSNLSPLPGSNLVTSEDNQSIKVYMRRGITLYDTEPYPEGCSPDKITFITRAMPHASYVVLVEIDGVALTEWQMRGTGVYLSYNGVTPLVRSLHPPAQSRGNTIVASGRIFTEFFDSTVRTFESQNNITQKITRVYAGNDICDMYDDERQLYGVSLYNPTGYEGYIECEIKSHAVGCEPGFSFLLQEYGRSDLTNPVKWVSRNGQLCSIQIIPEITSMSLHAGSMAGGTRIVLEGTNLNSATTPDLLEVKLNDLDCEVESVDSQRMVLLTPEWTEENTRDYYAGSRGVALTVGIGDHRTHNLEDAGNLTTNTIEKFYYKNHDGYGRGAMIAYYVATYSGPHTFYLYGQCSGDLYMSLNQDDPSDEVTSMNPDAKTQLLDNTRRYRWYDATSSDSTAVLQLTEGHRYYIEIQFNCVANDHEINLAVHTSTSAVNHAQHHMAADEIQIIDISAGEQSQQQLLDLTSYSVRGRASRFKVQISFEEDDSNEFYLCASQACTATLLAECSARTLRDEMNQLFTIPSNGVRVSRRGTVFTVQFNANLGNYLDVTCHGACSVEVTDEGLPDGNNVVLRMGGRVSLPIPALPTAQQVHDAISNTLSAQCPSFLLSDEDTYYMQDYEHPQDNDAEYLESQEMSDPFCGRRASVGTVLYHQQTGTSTDAVIPLMNYKWLCYAYKGSFWYKFQVWFKTSANGRNVRRAYRYPRNNEPGWHYQCLNIYDYVNGNSNQVEFYLTKIQLPINQNDGGGVVDLVSFRRENIMASRSASLPQYTDESLIGMRSLPPYQLSELAVEELSAGVFMITSRPNNGQDMDLVTVANDPDDTVVTELVSSAAGGIQGSFSLAFGDQVIENIPAGISGESLAEMIKDNSDLGRVQVTGDVSYTGFTYNITFIDQPGEQPLIQVETDLVGSNIQVEVTRLQAGSYTHLQVMGDAAALVYQQPQITVSVDGVAAKCSDCSFEYREDLTPVVSGISSNSGTYGSEFTVSMTGADTEDLSKNEVLIGGALCDVIAATANELRVSVGVTPSGTHPVVVRVAGRGGSRVTSSRPLEFTVRPYIREMEPTSGSMGGGYTMTLIGSGFQPDSQVSIGDKICEVSGTITPGQIICTVPHNAAGSVSVSIDIAGETYTAPQEFLYDSAATVFITSVSSTTARAQGGDIIVVHGSNFGDIWFTSQQSRFGATVSGKRQHQDTYVELISPPLAQGSYEIWLYIENMGYAVMQDGTLPVVDVTFEVHHVSPTSCSSYGGCMLTITGVGLPADDPEDYTIHIGDTRCDTDEDSVVSDTEVQCWLGDSSTMHINTNGGTHPEFGRGFQWDHLVIHAEVNDQVAWQWSAPSQAPTSVCNVYQTDSEADGAEYNGHGFTSGPASSHGSFVKRFITEGTYHYMSDEVLPYNDYRMGGVVIVSAKQPVQDELTFEVNGVRATNAPPSGRSRRDADDCSASELCDGGTDVGSSSEFLGVSSLPCLGGVIDNVTPLYGSTLTDLQIEGRNLFSSPDCVEVMVGDYPCVVSDISGRGERKTVTCNIDTTPPDMPAMTANRHNPIRLRQGSYGYALFNSEVSSDRHFYLRSAVTAISPTTGSVSGGTDITITGEGFVEGSTTVDVDGFGCEISSVDYFSIVCRTTARPSAGTGVVDVIVNEVSSMCEAPGGCDFEASFEVAPTLESVTPDRHDGEAPITIRGSNFGNSVEDLTVRAGSLADCEVLSAQDDQIECHLHSAQFGYAVPISVRRSNIGYSVGEATFISRRKVHDIRPLSGSTEGGNLVTISGSSFTEGRIRVRIGEVDCVIQSITLQEIVCSTPPQPEGTHRIWVHHGRHRYPGNYNYQYLDSLTPIVLQASPNSGSAGTVMTVIGSGFSPSATVTVGGVECVQQDVASNTDTSLTCVAGEHAVGEVPVQVNVLDKGAAQCSETFRYEFTLTDISPNTGSHGGGFRVTLMGTGLRADDEMFINVCNRQCTDVQGTTTEVSCVLPFTGNLNGDETCEVAAFSSGLFASMEFTYTEELTPVVEDVFPRRGGTGGGVDLTITGTNFGFASEDLSVRIGDAGCSLLSVADTQIICDTDPTSASFTGTVVVNRSGYGDSVEIEDDAGMFQYIDVWSSPYTWGISGLIPVDGDMVVVPEGQVLVLDMDTPMLKVILIQGGSMIFDDTDITLRAENILITDGGLFQVGTEREPFEHQANIFMYGRLRAPELAVYGAKSIGVRHGALELHGRHIDTTWTLLAETVEARSTEIVLQQRVDWRVGDYVVIASTGDKHSQRENEKRQITAISEDQQTLTLDRELNYKHLGITEYYGDTPVEMRAEVGLLTRNVVVRGMGDPAWEEVIEECPENYNRGQFATRTCARGNHGAEMGSDQFGAVISAHHPDMDSQKPVLHLENVELNYVGQAFRIGRYPVHFHINGNMSQSYVKGCSIHRSFNRAVNIHNSHNILVQNNVIYDVMGGAVFLEDSIETGNIFEYNLLVYVKASSSLRTDDITPASFWITHPSNILRHNHVAAGTHFAYWYRMLEHPEATSFTTSICPQHALLTEFYNNTAHSMGQFGLWIMEKYFPKEGGTCDSRVDVPARFTKLIAWNNDKGGECVTCGSVHFVDFVMINNRIEYMHAKQESMGVFDPEHGAKIENAVVAAHAQYEGHPECSMYGLVLPFDHGLIVDGISFYNFDGSTTSKGFPCSALGHTKVACKCSNLCGAKRHEFSRVHWENSVRKAYPRYAENWILADMDGTLTGLDPHSTVLTSSPNFDPELCQEREDFLGAVPSMACSSGAKFARVSVKPLAEDTFRLQQMTITNRHGTNTIAYHQDGQLFPTGWLMILPTGDEVHKMEFLDVPEFNELQYSLSVAYMEEDEYIILANTFTRAPTFESLIVGSAHTLPQPEPLTADSRTGDWHMEHDGEQYTVSYMVSDRSRYLNSGERAWLMQVSSSDCVDLANCPEESWLDGDVLPAAEDDAGPPPVNARWTEERDWVKPGGPRWSTGESTTAGIPQTGAHVVIPEGAKVSVDESITIDIETLEVFGELEFVCSTSRAFNLRVKYLYISGSFKAGRQGSACVSALNIELYGDSQDADYEIVDMPDKDGTEMGAKAIGVYGELSLVGASRGVSWVKLRATASAGSTVLRLEEPVTWMAGDEVIITSTAYDMHQAERRIIESVQDEGRNVILTESLEHNHLSEEETLDNELTYSIRAEVGLLTRNIKIFSQPSDEFFGGRLLFGIHVISAGNGFFHTHRGNGVLENVQFSHMGQRNYVESDNPHHTVAFVSTGRATSDNPAKLINCAFHDGYSTHVGVYNADDVEMTDNVITGSYTSAVILRGEHRFVHNLVARCVTSGSGDYSACVDLSGADRSTEFVRNTITSTDKVALRIPGELCPSQSHSQGEGWYGNEVRSALHGVAMYEDACKRGETCMYVKDFVVSRISGYGIYYTGKCNLEMTNVQLVDNSIGLLSIVAGPQPTSHTWANMYVKLTDSLVVGKSPWSDCETDMVQMDSVEMLQSSAGRPFFMDTVSHSRHTWGAGRAGIVVPSYLEKPARAPDLAWPMGHNPTYRGLTRISDVTFAHFGPSCGDQVDHVFRTSPFSPDIEHPVRVTNITKEDISPEALLYIGVPKLDFIRESSCGDLECDSKKKFFLDDSDGTLTSSPSQVFFIPQSERAWGGDRTRGIGDFRIPGPMQVNADGERLPIDEVRPHKGIARPEDAEFLPNMPGYLVRGTRYVLAIFESLDYHDFETRRPGPLVIRSSTGYVDIINGPRSTGNCNGYPCARRPAAYYALVALGETYDVFYTADPPANVRIHLNAAGPWDIVRFNIYFGPRMRMDVYFRGAYMMPLNARSSGDNIRYTAPPPDQPQYFYRTFLQTGGAGTNYYNTETRTMSVVAKGPHPLDIRQTEVTMVEFGLEMIEETSFFEEDLIMRIAMSMRIPLANIRIVQAVSANDRGNTMLVEIGSSPQMHREDDVVPTDPDSGGDHISGDQESGRSDVLRGLESLQQMILDGTLARELGIKVLNFTLPVEQPSDNQPGEPVVDIDAVCEDVASPSSVVISCEDSEMVRIDNVMWGRDDESTCGGGDGDCQSGAAVRHLVDTKCDMYQNCTIEASSAYLGDNPCEEEGGNNYFTAQYDCVPLSRGLLGGDLNTGEYETLDESSDYVIIPEPLNTVEEGLDTVIGWKVKTANTNTVHLSLWAKQEENTYSYIGGTVFTPQHAGYHQVLLREEDYITVQPGATLGLFWRDAASVEYNEVPCQSDDESSLRYDIHDSLPVDGLVTFSDLGACRQYAVAAILAP